MNILLNLVSTNAGWLARQAIKYSAVGAAVITAWLVGHGFDATHASVIAAGVTSIILGGIEAGLSFVARKYAVPELENVNTAIDAANKSASLLAILLFLPSCGTTATGEKTFLGITSKQGLAIFGDAIKREALPVSGAVLSARAANSSKNPTNVQP